jgi:hypothetical protein
MAWSCKFFACAALAALSHNQHFQSICLVYLNLSRYLRGQDRGVGPRGTGNTQSVGQIGVLPSRFLSFAWSIYSPEVLNCV